MIWACFLRSLGSIASEQKQNFFCKSVKSQFAVCDQKRDFRQFLRRV
jgi:hypothetical protein